MARILIADDDAHVARVMGLWLQRHGHDVVSVGNGEQALTVITGGGIDLLLSDMNMPVMDGVTLAKTLRGQGIVELPIIMLTARCDQESLARQLADFAVTVYPKPFVPSKLVEDVNARLSVAVDVRAAFETVTVRREVPCPSPR